MGSLADGHTVVPAGDGYTPSTGTTAPSALAYARARWATARPLQILLIATVFALGLVVAVGTGEPLSVPAVRAGLAALLPTAASVHYANESVDRETDRFTAESGTGTSFSGGSGTLARSGQSASGDRAPAAESFDGLSPVGE